MKRHPISEKLSKVTKQLVDTYALSTKVEKRTAFHLSLPSRTATTKIIQALFSVFYPGYHGKEYLDRNNVSFHVGSLLDDIAAEISVQIFRAFEYECLNAKSTCTDCGKKTEKVVEQFFQKLPAIRKELMLDVQAAYDGDPAAKNLSEIIFSYPGLQAITIYRVAHVLHALGVPLLPRIMTEYAHSETGIDIHPAAQIGKSFFIDHGTGVVIGETTIIGKKVRIYQGVTLGGLSMKKGKDGKMIRGTKRHPTICDDVVIYAGATILGGETIIGKGAIIGGNTWVIESVPAFTKVMNETRSTRMESKTSALAKKRKGKTK